MIIMRAGVDDFCKAGGMAESVDASPAVAPTSVVYIESKNIEAVKEALKTHGPVSVGIDAEPIPFRYLPLCHSCDCGCI